MRLEFSAEAADRFGFCQAVLANGQKVNYTNLVNDEFDKPQAESGYGWKDKVVVYVGKDNDIVGYDLTYKKKETDFTYGMRSASFINRSISGLRKSMLNVENNNTTSLKK